MFLANFVKIGLLIALLKEHTEHMVIPPSPLFLFQGTKIGSNIR